MKNKFKVGEKVRITKCAICKIGGCIGKIGTIKHFNQKEIWPYEIIEKYTNLHEANYSESELKPYRPSRMNGKTRDEKGRLRSKKMVQCPYCDNYAQNENQLKNHILLRHNNKQPIPTPEKIEIGGTILVDDVKKYIPTPEKIEKINIPVLAGSLNGQLLDRVHKLIDANSALEERVSKLEKRV